jgi:hypothetical protein
MKIKPAASVIAWNNVNRETVLNIASGPNETPHVLDIPRSTAYVPLINAHDHLIGNWVPRAGDHRPYPNSHIWVQDMKESFSFHERNNFWFNDGTFKLCNDQALVLAKLGCYKNLFSGCGVVHDHAPVQGACYYDSFPILVPRAFRQCHSITLGNWWGDGSAEDEMQATGGKVPFIIHLGEGTDDITRGEFAVLEERGLLMPNTMMIHGVALTKEEFARTAKVGASVCWCPTSNYYLLGKTLDVDTALAAGVNLVIGTDSTMSGAVNLIFELVKIRETHPHIPEDLLYKMITENAAKALMLPDSYAHLNPESTHNLLLTDAIESDPFANLITIEAASIKLLIVDGIPRFGDSEWLETLGLDEDDYCLFRTGNREKFVIGDPLDINDQIDAALGYHKDFPYLPF